MAKILKSCCSIYGDMLTEKQQNMIQYYYNEDLSLPKLRE